MNYDNTNTMKNRSEQSSPTEGDAYQQPRQTTLVDDMHDQLARAYGEPYKFAASTAHALANDGLARLHEMYNLPREPPPPTALGLHPGSHYGMSEVEALKPTIAFAAAKSANEYAQMQALERSGIPECSRQHHHSDFTSTTTSPVFTPPSSSDDSVQFYVPDLANTTDPRPAPNF